jgi:hypothetical protein
VRIGDCEIPAQNITSVAIGSRAPETAPQSIAEKAEPPLMRPEAIFLAIDARM